MFGGHLQCCEDEGSNSVSFWFTIPLECFDAVPPSPSVMMRKQLTVTPDIANQSISSYHQKSSKKTSIITIVQTL